MKNGQYLFRDGQHQIVSEGTRYTVRRTVHATLEKLKPGQMVAFELENGSVTRVEVTTATQKQSNREPVTNRADASRKSKPKRKAAQPATGVAAPAVQHGSRFLYPYNFVPFHTRAELNQRPEKLRKVGQGAGHDRWREGGYSGKLVLQFETKSPLLNVEFAEEGKDAEPDVYRARKAPDGSSAMAGSNIKGMLRTLYEQATGSRLGLFSHDERLSYREGTAVTKGLCLAQVIEHDAASKRLKLGVFKGLKPRSVEVSALPVRIPTDSIPPEAQHGKDLAAWLQLHETPGKRVKKWRNGAQKSVWVPPRRSWTVLACDTLPSALKKPSVAKRAETALVEGVLHATGKAFPKKTHERLFVTRVLEHHPGAPDEQVLTEVEISGDIYISLVSEWCARIESLSDEPAAADTVLPLYAAKQERDYWKALNKGQTLFVRLSEQGELEYLAPGMITRGVDKDPPAKLLLNELHPAKSEVELTPADRVFGWVAASDGGVDKALRGKLRVGAVVQQESEMFGRQIDQPIALSPLGEPKESQARFYTRCKDGQPLSGVERSEMYDHLKHTLSGFKVYPTQYLSVHYWEPPARWSLADASTQPHRTAAGRHQYFLAANGTKKQVTFAIDSWVPIGTKFSVTVYFDDLNEDELAALFWVADLPEGCHRLGMGKPLGFGSIKMSIDWAASSVRNHQQMLQRYLATETPDGEEAVIAEDALKSLQDRYDQEFRQRAPKVYRAMINAAKGYGETIPVHYGWIEPAAPQAEGFHYFVANERGPKTALPPIHVDQTPTLSVLKKKR